MLNEGSQLAPLAIRLFSSITNSIPSERAFSAINFIHNRYRNRLTAENAEMLIFVFMNWRAEKAAIEERDEEELEALVVQLTGAIGDDAIYNN